MTTNAANDVVYDNVVAALFRLRREGAGDPNVHAEQRSPGTANGVATLGHRFAFGRSAVKSVPRNSDYASFGHYSLAIPAFMAWLDKRPDVKPLLTLYDVIPPRET